MSDSLIRTITSLLEPQLRFDWFCGWVERTPRVEAIETLENVLKCAERFETDAVAAVFPLIGWTAGAVDPNLARELQEEATNVCKRLEAFLLHAADCDVRFDRPEQPASGAAPAPSLGLTLGEKKSLARRPSRQHFDRLLAEPHPAVIEKLLANPRLTEADVLRLVTYRPARVAVQALVARLPRWLLNARVRLALALNPKTPLWQSTPLLVTLRRQELKQVVAAEDIPHSLREAALRHYDRRPPVPARVRVESLQ